MKILIIDDEKEVCIPLKEFFESENCTVSCVHNGLDAIEKQKFYGAQVILLDLRMPGISGIETLKELKKLGPVSVICTSAVTENSVVEECIKMGAYAFIPKPITLEELLDKVKTGHSQLTK